MSKAHQNSNLNIQNSIIGLGDSAQAYFPFDRDTNDTIFRSTPSANSSTTILPEGIAIEEATTNVSLKDGQNGTTPWWGDGSPSVSIMDPLVTFRGRKAAKFTTGTSGNCYLDSSGDLSTATSATSWTLSCYIKRVDGTPITALSSYLYVSNNTNVNGSAVITPVEDGWYRAVYTRTALISGYPTLTGFFAMGTSISYYLADWQVEAKAFPTSFVNGSRENGLLRIPLVFNNNMSFSFWHKPYKPNSEQGGQNTDLAIFGLGKYFYNASVTLWCSNGTVLTYIKGDTGISWQAIPSHIALSADDWLKEHHWSITFSGTNGWSQYKVYHNGMPLSTTSLNPAITAIDESFYGIESFGGASPDAIYRDLTVYNRVLTDDEVKALYNSSFNYNSEEGVCT